MRSRSALEEAIQVYVWRNPRGDILLRILKLVANPTTGIRCKTGNFQIHHRIQLHKLVGVRKWPDVPWTSATTPSFVQSKRMCGGGRVASKILLEVRGPDVPQVTTIITSFGQEKAAEEGEGGLKTGYFQTIPGKSLNNLMESSSWCVPLTARNQLLLTLKSFRGDTFSSWPALQ